MNAPVAAPVTTISPQAAMIWLMVVVSAADRDMDDSELHRIGEIVQTSGLFAGFDADRLIPTAQDCAAILQEPEGLSAVLGLVAEALPAGARASAFALARDIAGADGQARAEEGRVLELIQAALGL